MSKLGNHGTAVRRLTVSSFVSAVLQCCARDGQAGQLPVPCAAGNCGTHAASFVTSGAATAVESGQTLTVRQGSNNATLNWASFNISADGKVVFQQPNSSSIALNRIFDTNPSSIFGSLSANGQLYLINANGFVFGRTATVNVAGLIASSLNISDQTFSSGILSALSAPGTNQAALQPFTDSSGNPITNTGQITVQAGAQLTAADSGRLMLAAPTVSNSGSLSAPDGQVILAAGQKIYLQANSSPDMRGLLVEVDQGGTAWNQLTGELSAPRGNITLAGLLVNQDGRISATTSVSANGSITLEAADGLSYAGGNSSIAATQGGTLEIGAHSTTEILPEYSDPTTAVDAQTQLPSEISLTGEQVLIHGGTIDAPSGKLSVLAAADPSTGAPISDNSQARIRIDSGTTIDLAGSDAVLPMSANLVTVQLRANEFADDPTQRNGALRGQTVTVDMRADGGLGTPIADVSAAIAAIGKNIAQRTETGGTVTFQSEGDIVVAQGASIDVSGGQTTYQGGVIQTTQLVGANGQLYDIGSANPLLAYTGVLNPTFTQTYNQWGVSQVVPTPGLSHYETGYVQGATAGTVQFAAPNMSLGGTLAAAAVSGPYQRSAAQSLGGTLIIGEPLGLAQTTGAQSAAPPDFLSPSVSLTPTASPVAIADNTALPPQTLQLPISYLTSDGVADTRIYSNGRVSLPAGMPLQLAAGGALLIEAPRIDIDSGISEPGGSLTFENVQTVDSAQPGLPRLGIDVGAGVTLDVSGQWTNDSLWLGGVGTAQTLQNAGSITLQLNTPGSELVLGNQVSLKANGGAWLDSTGKITDGSGGLITLDANPSQAALQIGQSVLIEGFGVGTASGGTFALTAPRIAISQGDGTAWTQAQRVDDLTSPGGVLGLYAPLFSDYGFSSVELTATGAAVGGSDGDVLTVTSGTTINAQTLSWALAPGFQNQPTGGGVADFSQVMTLPQASRPVENVSLSVGREGPNVIAQSGSSASATIDLGDRDFALGSANIGNLDIQTGASILTDPEATLTLSSEGSIAIGGTLRAPGGNIAVRIPVPAPLFDPGYQPNQGIDLGPRAVLDVSGATVLTPNDLGLQLGTVLTGGTVSLDAARGTVVAQPGSLISIAGTSAPLDVLDAEAAGGYAHELVASAGGSLTVGSPESISLLGSLDAKSGVGNSGVAAAGSLEIDLTRTSAQLPVGLTGTGLPQLPGSSLTIELVDTTSGSSPNGPSSNLATVGLQQLEQSGIDSLTLVAGDRGGGNVTGNILIDTSATLGLARQITLDSATLAVGSGVNASLSAPYVQIGNSGATSPAAPTSGTGTLSVTAQQINLLGSFALQGVARTTLASSGDVQLEGLSAPGSLLTTGALQTAGDLTINAARVYPDTDTAFSIESLSDAGTVMIGQSTAAPGAPLSGGGAVSIDAANITISGTLMAPFGAINLTAGKSLTLTNGSLVSVAGTGLEVPYGQTEYDGLQWVYVNGVSGPQAVTGTPTKQVVMSAPSITMQPGATVDLKGGGDLYAYEWVPGVGGSTDALAMGQIPGLYAIIPAARGQAAPYDPEESGSSSHTATVYLSGGAGIPAGYYALLPPRYALLPGADLIQVEPSYSSAVGGQIGSLPNGTPVVAGYLTSGTTGLHAGMTDYEGFAIYPGGYAQQLAAYNISYASTYFTAQAAQSGTTTPVPVPADAGTVTFAITPALNNALDLEGHVLTAAAAGGRAAEVNLSAPDLDVGSGVASSGAISISGSVLQGWNAGELTLGGVSSADGSSVAVTANTVTVESGVQLSADQILLVAQQGIDLKPGASLASTSAQSGTPPAVLPLPETVSLTDASGNALPQAALLAVSDLNLPIVTRSGAASPQGATITLESGSSLSSHGALALDAPGSVTAAGTLNGQGASWSLSSSSISFLGSGSNSAFPQDTLNIGSSLIGSLAQAGAVRIASAGAIDIESAVSLGATSSAASPTLNSLTLVGSSIDNWAQGDSIFGARTLTVEGIDSSAPSALPVSGSGTLSLLAGTLNVGPGAVTVNGFGRVQAQVGGALVGSGVGGLSVAGGDLTINAVELTGSSDSQTQLDASGTLRIGAPTQLSSGNTVPTLVGGELVLSANTIDDAGAIVLPSGSVTLSASGDLQLAGTASIAAGGTMLHAVDQSAGSPGGTVALTAGGNLSLGAGSTISVSGAGAAPAGTLSVMAGGAVDMSGTLAGQASGGTGGNFNLNAGELTNGFTALATTLTAGGFGDAVNVRINEGDLDLTRGTLTANRITLTADTGAVNIAGALLAPSAAQRGFIGLYGGSGVTLDPTGQLHADGSGPTGRGGEIEISSTCATCSVTLDPGSIITTTGTAEMGELVIRAPIAGTTDVAVNVGSQGLGADVSRVGQVVLESVMVFNETSSTIGADLPGDLSSAANYLASSTIGSRLTTPSATPVTVQAGVEIQDSSAGDLLTLPSVDLSSYSQQGQVIDLTVRAAGGLLLTGSISDGFATQNGLPALGTQPSGTLRFVAGADLTSANPLATIAGSAADLTLAPAITVRTGTGDLALVAADDVVFGQGASAYTAGTPAANPIAIRVPGSTRQMNFPTNGGNVWVGAGNDILGSPVSGDGGNFSVSAWQIRQGNAQNAAQYGVDLAAFDWNVGALGGGDVSIVAGRDVTDLSAATGNSLVSAANSASGNPTFYGNGGGLSVTAGGNIGSAQVYVASGLGTLVAGGGLTSAQSYTLSGGAQAPVGSSFALGDAQISVWARQGVQVDALYNPTLLTQPKATAASSALNGNYFTYGSDSALSLESTDGNVIFELNPAAQMSALLGNALAVSYGPNKTHALDLPPNLSIEALQSDIDISTPGAILAPSATGELTLFAGRDIVNEGGGVALAMADSFASTVPTAASPGLPSMATPGLGVVAGLQSFAGDIHAGDPNPVLITAGRDIDDLGLDVPKASQIVAGRDISELDYMGQNAEPSNITLISAGRDVTNASPDSSAGVQVGGGGSVDVLAGRDVYLGFSNGITTVGSLINPNLPSGSGADVAVMAGFGTQGADYSNFLQKVIAPSTTYQSQLVSYVESVEGESGLTFSQAQSTFDGLSPQQQSALIDQVFFNELLLSGREANSGSGVGFARGYAAIDALFPNSQAATATGPDPYSGNLNLIYSQIYTESGGNISILTPGGKVDVGLANASALVSAKQPSQLGIVAEAAGNVDIYSMGDVNVNQARIFTLGGGNILIWSDTGSIDAGNGAKSSLSVPPPSVQISAQGVITFDYSGAVAGSGIRTIQTEPDTPAGNVDLDAPVGTVNAGDAGIGSAGNINIAAQHVIGANNIQFGGTATGVPPEVSNLGASLSSASAVANSASTSATAAAEESTSNGQETAPLAQSAISWLDVFVTGLGEENCKPEDLECLKRQKPPQ